MCTNIHRQDIHVDFFKVFLGMEDVSFHVFKVLVSI